MPPSRSSVRAVIVLCLALGACLGRQPAIHAAGEASTSMLLLGTGNAGVYRSTDGGAAWQPARTGLPAGGVWQVQADPNTRDVAYLTTGTVFRTADAGLHWQPVSGISPSGAGVTALTTRGPLLLAAAPGGILAGGSRAAWVAQLPPVPGGAPRQIAAAGEHLVYAVGAGGALYLHGDLAWLQHGAPWQALHGGLPNGPITAFTYVPETARPQSMCPNPGGCVELYAGVAGHGLWQSNDSGHSWQQESSEQGALPVNVTIRAVLSTELHTIYAAVEGLGIYGSQHSGQFWQAARSEPRYTYTALVQAGSSIVAAAVGHGVQVFDANTATFVWRKQGQGLPAGVIGISLAAVAATAPPPVRIAKLPGPCATLAGYQLCGPFRQYYYANHPPLLLFGYPISPPQYDKTDPRLIVQYFDRARLEYRPYQSDTVRVTPLGRLTTATRRFVPQRPERGMTYFQQTGFNVGRTFLAFWRTHGGARILGYPISPELREANGDGSNRTYTLQYFENARLELHPEQSGPFSVELGLLGRQYLCLRTGALCRN
ncbi:MAG: hypothetical protein JWO42_3781 [Chloroflexi bacterium]|nr:hypothetical protein [Chloroflexota bacterium]